MMPSHKSPESGQPSESPSPSGSVPDAGSCTEAPQGQDQTGSEVSKSQSIFRPLAHAPYHILWLIGAAPAFISLGELLHKVYEVADKTVPFALIVNIIEGLGWVSVFLLVFVHQLMMYLYLEDFEELRSEFEQWLSNFLGSKIEMTLRLLCFISLLGAAAKLGFITHMMPIRHVETGELKSWLSTDVSVSFISSILLFVVLLFYDLLAIKSEKVTIIKRGGQPFNLTKEKQESFSNRLLRMLFCDVFALALIASLVYVYVNGQNDPYVQVAVAVSAVVSLIYIAIMFARLREISVKLRKNCANILISLVAMFVICVVIYLFWIVFLAA